MAKKRYIMAVDLGASNGRCILGEWDGEKLSGREILRFPNGPIETADGRLWWNIPHIYTKIIEALQKCAAEGCRPECIGIDSWAQDFGLIDSTGLPLSMTRCYRDTYTQAGYDRFLQKYGADWLFDRTGTLPFSGSTLFQLAALQEQSPALVGSAHRLLHVPNLLNYFLGGVVSCDCTLSSFSQLYDNRANCWSRDIIDTFSLPDVFPEVLIPGQLIGQTGASIERETGCRPKLALVAGHDTASALYAAPDADDPETLVISSGTWSMMMSVVSGANDCRTNSETCAKSQTVIPGCNAYIPSVTNGLGAQGEHILTNGVTGMWMLQRCMHRWELENRFPGYPALEQYAFAHPAEAFFDVDAPELSWTTDMEEEIGRLCRAKGFTAPKDPFEFYNTILNSLAIKYAATAKSFEELTGVAKKRIRMLSGGSKAPVLVELTRRHTGCDILTGPVEASCVGNLALQLTALGECAPGERPALAHEF